MIWLQAPAKINLCLKVTGRRPDGYHLLEMAMVKLELADEIEYEIVPEGISIDLVGAGSTRPPTVPQDHTNTLWKIAELVTRESGKKFGIRIFLKKNIPTAAGLGGGSSDAASLLLALNRELELGWTEPQLISLGVKVGADAPFFLGDGPKRVSGIGEILEPIAVPSLPLVLVNPGFSVSTADVYRWWDQSVGEGVGGATGGPPSSAWTEHSEGSRRMGVRSDRTRSKEGLTGPSPNVIPAALENDLERVVIPRYPVLARMKDLLREAGALGALMSGSGPTVFGLFESQALRDRGYEKLLREDPRWWVWKGSTM